MSMFHRAGVEHTEVNRREVLLGAGGVAAATAIAGRSVEKQQPATTRSTLVIDDPDFTALEVVAWSWGISNSGTTHIGGGAGAGKANVQDVSVTAFTGVNSPQLFLAVATGAHFPKATLTWADRKSRHTVKIVMEDLLITSLSNGAGAGAGPDTDNLSLNFARVTFSVDAASAAFDIAQNT